MLKSQCWQRRFVCAVLTRSKFLFVNVLDHHKAQNWISHSYVNDDVNIGNQQYVLQVACLNFDQKLTFHSSATGCTRQSNVSQQTSQLARFTSPSIRTGQDYSCPDRDDLDACHETCTPAVGPLSTLKLSDRIICRTNCVWY